MRILSPVIKTGQTLWQFGRPHTVLGTGISIASLQATYGDIGDIKLLTKLLVPSLCANFFITGLNQITDYEIDVINKPHLPLPSKQLTQKKAINAILVALAVSLYTAKFSGWLLATTLASEIIGTFYSLKPFRWKRSPYLAMLAIVLVRGPIINIGYQLAIAKKLQSWFPVFYFSIFSILIALMKDMPDIEGDMENGIDTFSIEYGSKNVRNTCEVILGWLFAFTAIAKNWLSIYLIAAWFYLKCQNTENVYMALWKIFYSSYLVLPYASSGF